MLTWSLACTPSPASVRDDLVGVHVRGGARAGLEDVDRELAVVLARGDLARGRARCASALRFGSSPSSPLTAAAAPLCAPASARPRRARSRRRSGSSRRPWWSRRPTAALRSASALLRLARRRAERDPARDALSAEGRQLARQADGVVVGHQEAGARRARAAGRWAAARAPLRRRRAGAAVAVGPQQQHGHRQARVEVEQLRAARPAASARAHFAHERARLELPGTSAKRWRKRSARGGVAARATARTPRCGREDGARRRRRAAGRARARPRRARDAPGRAQRRGALGRRVQAVGHQHEARRAHAGRCATACSRISAPASWPREQRARAEHLGAEAGRAPRRTSRACRGGAGAPRSRRAAAGRAARRGSGRRAARRPVPTPCARAGPSAAARAAGRRRARDRRRARRRGGGRGAAASLHRRTRRSRRWRPGRARGPVTTRMARSVSAEHPLIPDREVDPRRELPELELEVLARWRERDVFAESLRRARGRRARGASTRARRRRTGRPGSHHVLSRVFKDIYPRFQTMRGLPRGAQGRLGLPRPAGRDRRRTAARDQIEGRDRGVRDRALQRAVPRVGLHVPGRVGPADRADRLLARPGARLPHAGRELHRVGLVGADGDRRARAAVRGPQGRARTARAARRRCPRTRSRSATATWSTRACT